MFSAFSMLDPLLVVALFAWIQFIVFGNVVLSVREESGGESIQV